VRIVNWNTEWANLRSVRGQAIRAELDRLDPDLICLTEGSAELLPAGGQVIESGADYGYGVQVKRRKVLLWAREGFSATMTRSPEGMPCGRFVSAMMRSPDLRVVGVCIPWSRAHVSTGQRNRQPWQDHLSYLSALRTYFKSLEGTTTCVLGDFNQTIPRSSAPLRVDHELASAFAGFMIPTASRETEPRLLDHLALSPGAGLTSWAPLPMLSDHLGWVGEVSLV
jgi:exonuclease III